MSPLAQKRWRSFRRIRRAWWSLWLLGAIFLFCMCADWVSGDPNAVVEVSSLEKYRTVQTNPKYEVRSARYSVLENGEVVDFEGPEDVKKLVLTTKNPAKVELPDCKVSRTVHPGYARIYIEPQRPPTITNEAKELEVVSFPFRPVPGHPFGIDAGGRDVYARVVHGMRIALVFGVALALSGMFFGMVIGALEGYFGGVTDIVLQRFTEIWSALPFLYVMIFIGSTVGRSFAVLLVCYAIFNWITVSYYMRAEFLRLRRRAFVDAAKVQGVSLWRIIFVHILPNAMTPLITLFPFLLMGAIGSLAALDFLGFGLPPMTPSCGELMQEAQQFRSAWWLILYPSLALFIVMLLTVLVGEGLRDAFDPRHKATLE